MKAEKGMTWNEWLTSEYNTLGVGTTVWDANYNEVALDSEIVAGKSYGFMVVENSSETFKLPLTWNTVDVSGNVDGKVAKISNFVPSIDDLSNTWLYTDCSFFTNRNGEPIVGMFEVCEEISNGNYECRYYGEYDWNTEYEIFFVVVSNVDELIEAKFETEGLSLQGPGLYTLDFFALESISANFKIFSFEGGILPEKNEYGFYYDVSYNGEMDGEPIALIFNKDGSIVLKATWGTGALPAGSVHYSSYAIDASAGDIGIGTVSSNGTSITFADIGTTFVLNTSK